MESTNTPKQTEKPDINLFDTDSLPQIIGALKEIEALIMKIDTLWNKFLNGSQAKP